VKIDRFQLAKEFRARALHAEAEAAGWAASAASWRSRAENADLSAGVEMPDLAERNAKRHTMKALDFWKQAWVLEHCVEHADCLANPELAKACLTDTLTPLQAECGPTGSLCALGWRLPPVPREHTCYGGCVTVEWSLWAGSRKQACAPSKRAPSRRCPRG